MSEPKIQVFFNPFDAFLSSLSLKPIGNLSVYFNFGRESKFLFMLTLLKLLTDYIIAGEHNCEHNTLFFARTYLLFCSERNWFLKVNWTSATRDGTPNGVKCVA